MNGYADQHRIEVIVPWYDAFRLGSPSKRLELHRLVIRTDTNQVADHVLDDQP